VPGRGPQTFKKRQKEQERRERQQEKMAKRLERKNEPKSSADIEEYNPMLEELRHIERSEP
jgi:membrane-associated HD superfamily phosphohydrolase